MQNPRLNKILAILIGSGIILFAIHNKNQPFITYMFLPQIGMILVCMCTFMYVVFNYKSLTLGSKYIYIPLLIIVVSIIVSSIINSTFEIAVASSFFAMTLFGLYLVCRSSQEKVFKPFIYAVILGALGCIIYGFKNGHPTGGFISPTNYDMASGLLILGTLVSAIKHQWWLSLVCIIGLLFTGAEEALVAVALLFIALIIRSDWSKKLIIVLSVIIIGIASLTFTGYMQRIYTNTINKASVLFTGEVKYENRGEDIDKYFNTSGFYLNNRFDVIKKSLEDIKPLGHGYDINHFTFWTVHNVPLIILYQVGILAALAWVWVTIYCLIKTKWKYAFIAIIALSLFDHYIWTQFAPFWWALVGVSTVSDRNDLIFKNA